MVTPGRKRSRVWNCYWVRKAEGKEAQKGPGEGYSEREEGKNL